MTPAQGLQGAQKRPVHPERKTVFAVVGAGNGGQAMAAHLALMGAQVILYNRSAAPLAAIWKNGGIELEGALTGKARPWLLTSRLEPVASQAQVLMIVVPATAHRALAAGLAPHLRDGQVVILHPGRTLGAVEFGHVLRMHGCRAQVVVAEAQSLLYAARAVQPGQVHVYGLKNQVRLAALPATKTREVLQILHPYFPQFVGARNVFETSLDNVGAVFHPAPVLLNAGRIEGDAEPFDYYHRGITPAVARVLERVDAERLAVAAAYGVAVPSALEWLGQVYGARGLTLYEALQDTAAYAGIRAPSTLDTRYLWEDVPASLVPLASLGQLARVPCPTMRSLIHLASVIHGVDYWGLGRRAERLGLGEMNRENLHEFVQEGRVV